MKKRQSSYSVKVEILLQNIVRTAATFFEDVLRLFLVKMIDASDPSLMLKTFDDRFLRETLLHSEFNQ